MYYDYYSTHNLQTIVTICYRTVIKFTNIYIIHQSHSRKRFNNTSDMYIEEKKLLLD